MYNAVGYLFILKIQETLELNMWNNNFMGNLVSMCLGHTSASTWTRSDVV
jgi:hypothetical protein